MHVCQNKYDDDDYINKKEKNKSNYYECKFSFTHANVCILILLRSYMHSSC